MSVLVAMSGGVDSSVAAALLVEEGHEVVGLTLLQGFPPGEHQSERAGEVARQLGIVHHVVDSSALFREHVIGYLGSSYIEGRTPNPCIECNRRVRFPALLDEADRLGCSLVATGHHARVRADGGGYHLLRAVDQAKDQSYVLHMLGQRQLSRLRFPVGGLPKAEVRRLAEQQGLASAGEPDSQDLCFVEGDYRQYLQRHFPEADRPGPMIDPAGRLLGRHRGIAGFTVGQRKGLGFAAGEPRYVLEVRPATATVVVGGAGDLAVAGCRVSGVSFVSGRPPGEGPIEVKVRYRSPAVPARLEPEGLEGWQVRFDAPQRAVTPGQAAVFYRGEETLGGGTILGSI